MEIVHPDGASEEFSLDRAGAHALYAEALENAKNAGFEFSAKPIRLTPQKKLVEIVRRSQELALEGKGGDETGDSSEQEG